MMKDRRLYSPGPILNGPVNSHRTKIRICLVSACVLLLALIGFIWYTGTAVLYIHYWAYIAVAAAILLLFIGAGAFAIHDRFKSERARRNMAVVLFGAMLMLATIAIAFCYAFTTMLQPLGFFDSPEGENRIVIMRSVADDGALITAYPAIGDHFYIAALESEVVHSNGVVQGVEWENERLAKVLLCDIDGNDTTITVDFAPLYSGGEEAAE